MRYLKYALIGLAILALGFGGFVFAQVTTFNNSMAKVYEVPAPTLTAPTDAASLARGKHLAESIAACTSSGCHGADLAGGTTLEMGPLGRLTGPNLTPGKVASSYSDGELQRLIQQGIKKSGESVTFMPAQHFGWLPDEDTAAIIAYVRSVPSVDKPNGPVEITPLMKVLDRFDQVEADIARRIDHTARPTVPAPAPTAEYGRFIALQCTGCHGTHFSGGRIPGTPPEIPTPLNITLHETGIKDWSFADFERLLKTGIRKNGKKLHPFMPLENVSQFDDIEIKATWAALQAVPPRPFGER